MEVATRFTNKDKALMAIRNRTTWSESIINSFTDKALNNIYNKIIKGIDIYKMKIHSDGYKLHMMIPKKLADKNNITYGDRFDISYTLNNKKLILKLNKHGKFKIGEMRKIKFPKQLNDKHILHPSDDALVTFEDGKIIIQSFCYMQ